MAIKHLWLPINGLEVIEDDLDTALHEGYQVISSHVVSSEHGSNIHFVLWLKEDDLTDESIPFTVANVSSNGNGSPDTKEVPKPIFLESFKQMVRTGNFIVLDTETTGLKDGEICQIVIIDSGGVPLLDTFVKPINPIPDDATRIHGITDEMVKEYPTWEQVSLMVESIFANHDNVIVHNATYDRKMMHQSAEKAGLPKVEWKKLIRWHCAMQMFAEVKGDWNDYHKSYRWHKLIDACKHYDIPVADAHDALGDCYMTLAVVNAMAGDKVLAD